MSAVGYSNGMSSYAAASLPQPEPVRATWSTFVLGGGCLAMFVALLLVIAGVPASMFYDPNGKGERNRNTSHDPLKMSQSIDKNMKYVSENTGYKPNEYNGYLTSVADSEKAVPTMAEAVGEMTASVEQIDTGLTGVLDTTIRMQGDMEAMATTSANSATTMGALNGDIGELSGAMNDMYNATLQLTTAMGGIEKKAAAIAVNGTKAALKTTRELNAALPATIPAPKTSLTPGAV